VERRSCKRTPTVPTNIRVRALKRKEIVQSRIGDQQISRKAEISNRQMPGTKSG
jgi:hypothetical protein